MDERQREPLATEEAERMAREWDAAAHPGLWPRAARALLDELDAVRAELEDARKVAETNRANWDDARRRLQDVTDRLAAVRRAAGQVTPN